MRVQYSSLLLPFLARGEALRFVLTKRCIRAICSEALGGPWRGRAARRGRKTARPQERSPASTHGGCRASPVPAWVGTYGQDADLPMSEIIAKTQAPRKSPAASGASSHALCSLGGLPQCEPTRTSGGPHPFFLPSVVCGMNANRHEAAHYRVEAAKCRDAAGRARDSAVTSLLGAGRKMLAYAGQSGGSDRQPSKRPQ